MGEIIGLDIGSHSIKLVGLKKTSGGPIPTCAGIKEIPSHGNQEDVSPAAETLKALLDETGLKTKKVNLAISGPGVHITRVILPSMPKGELKEAVRWEIKGILPYPVETALVDFHVIEEFVEDGVKKLDLLAVACPQHLIDRTLSIVQETGLHPLRLDVAPNALWNALLSREEIRGEETFALVDLGAKKTGIHFFRNGTLQFSREVTPAQSDMTLVIKEGVYIEGKPTLSHDQAERLKQQVGIPLEAQQETMIDESINLFMVSCLVRPVLERLVAEIGRSLDYYKTQFNVERIDRVLLTGGGANLKNIVTFLSAELGSPVELFDPFGNLPMDSPGMDVGVLGQMGPSFATALGVALSEPKRIELLPAKKPIWSTVLTARRAPALALVVLLAAFAGVALYTNGQMAAVKKEWETKTSKLKELETLQAKLNLFRERKEKIKQNLSLFPPSLTHSVPYREVLKEVSRIVPANVTLTLLSFQKKERPSVKNGAPSAAREGELPKSEGRELHLAGVAFGSDSHSLTAIAEIIERLERSPLFQHIKLVTADETKLYNRPGAEFEIVCDINLNAQSRRESP